MPFMTLLAVVGLVASSALLGAWAAGLLEQTAHAEEERPLPGRFDWTPVMLAFVLVCTALILVEPAVIAPHWLQYAALIAAPAALGFAARLLLARRMARQTRE